MKNPVMASVASMYDSQTNGKSQDLLSPTTAGSHNPLSPTNMKDKNNMMLDMAVAADKTPFMCANKANKNLQRALNRFLIHHEREKKMANRKFEQQERFYKKRVARCSTALPRTKHKTFNTIEEEASEEVSDLENQWAITKAPTIARSSIPRRPKTAGSPLTLNRIKITPPDTEDLDMTYTFNSLFGEVQKHVIVPSPGPDEEDSEEEEDPLSLLSTPRRSSSLNPHDVQGSSPPMVQHQSKASTIASRSVPFSPGCMSPGSRLKRCESIEVYHELERKRTSSGSELLSSGEDTKEEPQYVCENVFGNLSLQMYKDSRLDKVELGTEDYHRDNNETVPETVDTGELAPPQHNKLRRTSGSEIAFQQLARVRKCELNTRKPSICSDLFSCSSTNSVLTYAASNEPGMAVSKAVNFLDKLDKFAGSRRSKLHEDMRLLMSANNSKG